MVTAAPDHHRAGTGSPRGTAGVRFVAVVVGCAVALAAPALAGGGAVTVKSTVISSPSETVAANASGRTLYSLSGETAHHLKCASSECTRFWPPLTAPSRSAHLHAAAGVHGALGLIRRRNGTWQVTLRGKPLYRYSGDTRSGQASGEGIQTFGGTWHAVTAVAAAATPTPSPAPPMTPESSPPYTY